MQFQFVPPPPYHFEKVRPGMERFYLLLCLSYRFWRPFHAKTSPYRAYPIRQYPNFSYFCTTPVRIPYI